MKCGREPGEKNTRKHDVCPAAADTTFNNFNQASMPVGYAGSLRAHFAAVSYRVPLRKSTFHVSNANFTKGSMPKKATRFS
jgi:hypothetical protein